MAATEPAGKKNGYTKIAEYCWLNPTQQNRVVVKDNGKIKIIPTTNIHYLEAADDYVKIHTSEGVFLKE
jgi:two-component system LytT family response regulator